jgi:hypothetical protein
MAMKKAKVRKPFILETRGAAIGCTLGNADEADECRKRTVAGGQSWGWTGSE